MGFRDDRDDYDFDVLQVDPEDFNIGGLQDDDDEEDGDIWPEFGIHRGLRFRMEAGEQDRQSRGVRETERPRRTRFQKRQRLVAKPVGTPRLCYAGSHAAPHTTDLHNTVHILLHRVCVSMRKYLILWIDRLFIIML